MRSIASKCIVAVACATACLPRQPGTDGRVPDQTAAADSILAQSLTEMLERVGQTDASTIARTSAQYHTMPSSMVPGLVYRIVHLRPPQSSDVVLSRVVGIRNGSVRLIRGRDDWLALAGDDWRPVGNEAASLRACKELYSVLIPESGHLEPRVYEDDSWFALGVGLSPEQRARVYLPRFEPLDGGISVGFWTMEVLSVIEIRCVLPQAGPPQVELVNFIRGVGLLGR